MIKIEVDEAYAFDFLSIVDVKKNFNDKNNIVFENYLDSIKNQIGEGKTESILNSEEYRALYDLNKNIFDIIETIRAGEKVDAKVVDDANMDRYRLKVQLQKKFFNEDVNEWKS